MEKMVVLLSTVMSTGCLQLLINRLRMIKVSNKRLTAQFGLEQCEVKHSYCPHHFYNLCSVRTKECGFVRSFFAARGPAYSGPLAKSNPGH